MTLFRGRIQTTVAREVTNKNSPTSRNILIYGNSLFVAGVAAELGAVPGLTIKRVNLSGLTSPAQLQIGCPTALIVDLATIHGDLLLHCLLECSTLVVVGLDLRHSRVIVLNSQFFPVKTLQELMHVLAILHNPMVQNGQHGGQKT
jgi:hypothetical protein